MDSASQNNSCAAFFADSAVGLSIVDTQLNYQAINNALAEMNGFSVDAHLGKSMRDILGNRRRVDRANPAAKFCLPANQ